MKRPLILVTNDDGIDSPGLWAAVEAVLSLGEVLVVAPDRQWSGGGRAMPPDVSGRLRYAPRTVQGKQVPAFSVDASPALAVVHAVLELALRRPALVVSGINHGLNPATEVTVSGTVGAALEGAAFGIPALAVSLEMDVAYHLTGHDETDYTAAKSFTQQFARRLLAGPLPFDVDVLNVNIPAGATPATPWQVARLARQRYFVPTPPDRATGQGRPGYKDLDTTQLTEAGSDVWALRVERAVAVTPLSLDLTSRVDLDGLGASLGAEPAFWLDAGSWQLATLHDL